ncbi:ANTAR domain-containing protein [Actinomycetes bacterium M1A6_2h]
MSFIDTRATTPSRTDIDLAVGVLIGLYGYTRDHAFEVLVRRARSQNVGLLRASRTVIESAQRPLPQLEAHVA